MTRPWARTLDLISSEYGWTDEVILDCTLARIRQIREVIFERLKEQRKDRLQTEEIKMRHLMSTIQASQGNKRGVREAQRFRLLPVEAVEMPLHVAVRQFPVDPAVGGMLTPEQIAEAQKRMGIA